MSIQLALQRSAAFLVPLACVAAAQAAPLVQADVPAGPLAAALNRFAVQAGVAIAVDATQLQGRQSAGLRGPVGDEQGFQRLLAGSGWQATRSGAGYVLVAAPAAAAPVVTSAATSAATPAATPAPSELPAVRITGRRINAGALAEPLPGGQLASASRLGLLGNLNVFETPYSTKAFTQQHIADRQARSVADVLLDDPSVRTGMSANFPSETTSIRGFAAFQSSYLFDGMQGLAALGQLPARHYERVELRKGPVATLDGGVQDGSNIGGSINLVPKRATDAPVRSVTLTAGSDSLFGGHVDLGQRFGPQQALGARLNLSVEQGALYNGAERRRVTPHLALDYRGSGLRATLDAGYSRQSASPAFNQWMLVRSATGVPRVPDGNLLHRPAWERVAYESAFGLLGVELDLNDHWTLSARHGRLVDKTTDRRTLASGFIESADGAVEYAQAINLLGTDKGRTSDLGLRGRFMLGATEHHVAVQMARTTDRAVDQRVQRVRFSPVLEGSIYQPMRQPDPFPGAPFEALDNSAKVTLGSLALADTVRLLDDRLLLLLAARHQSIESEDYDEARISPTAGALYKLGRGWSVYGNLATALAEGDSAPTGTLNQGEQLPPYVSRQREVGVKWDAGNWGLTVAHFDISRVTGFTDSDNIFKAAGRQRHRGLEIETFGEPLPGLRLLGGVAFVQPRMARVSNPALRGKHPIGTPQRLVNFGVTADVGALPGLSVNSRVIHTGKSFLDAPNTQQLPSSTRYDIGARYSTRLNGLPVVLRADVHNLFDKRYWTIGASRFMSPSEPRTFSLSVNVEL